MICTTCDGQKLKQLTQAGKLWLEHNHKHVNELNVFPVPDGDTGTNMLLTMSNAYKEIMEDSTSSVSVMGRRIAHGAMMGSRGNSGTILSQIWIGFADGLGDADTLDSALLAQALHSASEKSWLGVQKPVEGTILTVIREMAEEAADLHSSTPDLIMLLEKVIHRGWAAVRRTPELLPVLKQAGVVDSGGTGLVYILEGMYKHLKGEKLQDIVSMDKAYEEAVSAFGHSFEDSEYNYDVQFVLKGQALDVLTIKSEIEAMGDSGVIIGHDSLVKVHIHVDDPGQPLSYGTKLGVITDVVVENMQEQYEALRQEAQPLRLAQIKPGDVGVVAVSAGEGLARVFAELGVAGVVNGGQTNNPSTEEILKAIRSLETNQVIVLPNNKNIILAAEQAAKLSDDVEIVVIPTRTFPQGVAAMLPYRPDGDLSTLAEAMSNAKDDVLTGEVTIATRSVEIDGVAVRDGQCIGLLDGKLCVADDDIRNVMQKLLENGSDCELVTLYYGEAISAEDAERMTAHLAAQFEDFEFETVYGGQPHYQYILGME